MEDYEKVYTKVLSRQVPPEEVEWCLDHTEFVEGPAPDYCQLEETHDLDGWSFDIAVRDYTRVYYYKDS